MPLQINCRVRRCDYVEVGESSPYQGIENANIQIVDTRSGEVAGVIIRKDDAIEIVDELIKIFNLNKYYSERI